MFDPKLFQNDFLYGMKKVIVTIGSRKTELFRCQIHNSLHTDANQD